MKDHDKIILDAIGNKIQMARLNKGLSVKEIANKSSLSTSKIFKIESGEINLKLYTLMQIAEALEVDVKSLLVDNLRKDTSVETY